MREIKDGIYVENKYGQRSETYLIKTKIEENDRTLARMTKTEHLLLPWNYDLSVTIHSANLLGNDEKKFPAVLNKQTELYYLTIPSHLAKLINSVSFTHELRGLSILNGGNLKLEKSLIMKKLLYLHTGSGEACFTKENLPNLRTLSCKYRKELLPELYKYELFDKLTLYSVHNNIFNEISPIKDLYGLQILRGKLENVQGISTIKSLQWVALSDLPKLTDLSGLSELPALEYLEISYCKHIENWDFLLHLKRLKKLNVTASSYKDYPPQKILDTLREKGLKVPIKGS